MACKHEYWYFGLHYCIDSEDGGFNSGKLWKLKKKLTPSNYDPPTAMKDSEGNLITTENEILKEATIITRRCLKTGPWTNLLGI